MSAQCGWCKSTEASTRRCGSAVESIAPKIGCVPQTLLTWVKRVEIDTGVREGVTTSEAQRVKELERENKELRRANEISEGGERVFRPGGARPPIQVLRELIDEHRDTFGVEPICKVLQISPSGYRRYAALRRCPEQRCARAQRDEVLAPQIERVWQANMQVYGADKVWRQLGARRPQTAARCTVERLMRRLGLRGVMRGKVVRTTISDGKAPCPLDRVNRQFRAERPNQLWVSDFTYVSTWQGWQYVAFVIDVFARRIVGWRVSSSMRTDFVLDALEQALYASASPSATAA